MQPEPPEADPPKRKRRWFQFSLRSLLIVVTLFCVAVGGYIGWQKKILKERKEFVESNQNRFFYTDGSKARIFAHGDKSESPGPIRIWLGDEPQHEVLVPQSASMARRQLAAELFPESTIIEFP